MIVRIATEGQYELDGDDASELDELDHAAVRACETGDEATFHDAFARLLAYVREQGRTVDSDELATSDLILPPPDVSLEEARAEFSGEGLLPGG